MAFALSVYAETHKQDQVQSRSYVAAMREKQSPKKLLFRLVVNINDCITPEQNNAVTVLATGQYKRRSFFPPTCCTLQAHFTKRTNSQAHSRTTFCGSEVGKLKRWSFSTCITAPTSPAASNSAFWFFFLFFFLSRYGISLALLRAIDGVAFAKTRNIKS